MVSYAYAWRRFIRFCEDLGVAYMPAEPLIVACYLTEVTAKASTFSPVRMASAAIAAFHHGVGLPSPTEDRMVQSVREAAQRLLPDGVNKKEPLELQHVEDICRRFTGPECSLEDLMVCTAISLAFFAFFRYSDLARLHWDTCEDYIHHLDLFLEQRKTDQFREGQWVVVAAFPDSPACPRSLLHRLRQRLGAAASGRRPVFSTVGKDGYSSRSALPYKTCRELFLAKFAAVGLDTALFGTHSCRAGGATLAANLGVPDKLWREHGGWRSARAAQGYVKTAHTLKLGVTQAMQQRQPSPGATAPSAAPRKRNSAAPASQQRKRAKSGSKKQASQQPSQQLQQGPSQRCRSAPEGSAKRQPQPVQRLNL